MERDRQLEQAILDRLGAPRAYNEEVVARLDRFEAEHGNIGWEQSLDVLLSEIQQEAADVTGWGVGVAHQLEEGDPLLHRLVLALKLGVAAWREIDEVREVLAARS
jgi:hypothetical protein